MSVNSFLKPVISYIKSVFSEIDVIKYFTDGAASQYKNCKNFANLLHHVEDCGMRTEWNFFATSLGKGPYDGIGGTIKRLAYRYSLQGGNIQTPLSLFQWASSNIANMKMIFVDSNSIIENEKMLETRFRDAKTLPGTQSFHRFVPKNMLEINAHNVSENPDQKTFRILPEPEKSTVLDYNTLAIGTHVACLYQENGLWYLSEIIGKDDNLFECQMQFFSPSGPDENLQGFKSTKNKKDQAWVPITDVLKVVETLEKNSTWDRSFKIDKPEYNVICDLFI